MPELRIPCVDCARKTEEIELTGRYVVTSCDPIAGQSGWCLIKWKDREAPGAQGGAAGADTGGGGGAIG